MPKPAQIPLRRYLVSAGLIALAGLLGACAQQSQPGYYATEHDTTRSDAQAQAQGRSQAQAPAQLQFGFGQNAPKPGETAQAAAQQVQTGIPRPLREPKTYLGTLPCDEGEQNCDARRITLTLAPSGEWRARTVLLGAGAQGAAPTAERGCWSVIGVEPLRIMLQTANGNARANMSFVNDNVLRINRYNDREPALEYRLTRQPDIDAIAELTGESPLSCNS